MIDIKGLTKVFKDGDYNKVALDDINLKINDGEMVSIMGPSGSGKSTLLNIIACFDDVSKGEAYINDNNITSLKKRKIQKRQYKLYISRLCLIRKFYMLWKCRITFIN